jgi:hypothetical protein
MWYPTICVILVIPFDSALNRVDQTLTWLFAEPLWVSRVPIFFSIYLYIYIKRNFLRKSDSLWCDDPGAGEIPSGVFAGALGKIHCLSFPTRWENEAANSSLWTEGQLIIVDGGHITWNIYCIMGLFVSIKFILQLYYLYIGFNPMKIHSSFPWTSISRMDLMVKSHSIKSLIRCGHPLIPAGYRWFSELSNGCVRKWDPKIVILYGKEVGVSYFHTMWGPPVMLVGL